MPSLLIQPAIFEKNPSLGAPLRCTFFDVPPTRPETFGNKRGVVGLFADRDSIGPRLFLILSWRKQRNMDGLTTETLKEEKEGCALLWGATAKLSVTADAISFVLSHRIQTRLLPILGTEEQHLGFVLSRLVPRRCPVAIRIVSPSHFQYWASL